MSSPTAPFIFNHTGLRVSSLSTSLTFYTTVFGMKELFRMTLDAGTIAFVGYTTPENEQLPSWKREGVLELVESKVSRSFN